MVSVAAGSRASTLDILPGDELIAIDHKPVAATSANELDIVLAGAKGTPVVLTLQRRRLDGSVAQLDRAVQRAERVDVLQLGLDAQLFSARAPDRDVRLGAHLAFFHLGLGRAYRAEQGAQLDRVVAGLVGRTEVRLAHDLHQWDARAVEVDVRLPCLVQLVAGVDELPGVLLEVHTPDPDRATADRELAVEAHGQVVLTDLVALGQVGIHVVLAVELGVARDLAAQRERRLEARLDRGLVGHRQHARESEADLADVGVRRVAELPDRAAAEHLGARPRLDVNLHTDDDLPTSCPRRGTVVTLPH